MFSHLKNNKGDVNVSKMTLIAIAFVVGAILLVLTTSAFRNPINQWFSSVTNGWFAKENGQFDLMLNPFAYEMNSNGTIKGAVYRTIIDDNIYEDLVLPENIVNGGNAYDVISNAYFTNGKLLASGMHGYDGGTIEISPDGTTITLWVGAPGEEPENAYIYTAILPE